MEKHIEKFSEIRPNYERFRTRISELILELIKSEKIELASFESRTKTVESFKEKIKRKGNKYKDPINEITDLCGLRLITYYTEDIYKIASVLEKEFEIDQENSVDKTAIQNPDKFGYQSLHYIVTIDKRRNRLAEWKTFKNFKIEIQVRSILQHSWAAIDHKLRYKTKGEVPSNLKRKIFRLSALLELADEEFLSIKNETIELNTRIDESIDKGELDIELNSISLISYLTNSTSVENVIKIAESLGFLKNPFSQNESEELENYVSRLIGCLKFSNLNSIEDLEKLLNKPKNEINKALKEFITEFTKTSNNSIFAVKSDVVMILVLLLSEIDLNLHKEKLSDIIGWKDLYESIFKVK